MSYVKGLSCDQTDDDGRVLFPCDDVTVRALLPVPVTGDGTNTNGVLLSFRVSEDVVATVVILFPRCYAVLLSVLFELLFGNDLDGIYVMLEFA